MMLGKGGEEVQSRTLDSYNLTGVSLVKIDAQGAEPLVIYGGRVSSSLISAVGVESILLY
jgi:hypothetical protein